MPIAKLWVCGLRLALGLANNYLQSESVTSSLTEKRHQNKKRKKNPSLKIQKLRTENLGELALTAAFCSVASLLSTTHRESLEFNPPILQMIH